MWYSGGLKFECTKCGHCCTGGPGYVWITIPELYRIAEWLGMDDREFARTCVRKVGGRLSLIEKPNGDCVFYENGCTIYPVRPSQCRTFPFWREIVERPSAWEQAAVDCPGINQGPVHSEEEIQALLQEA
jgi:Fe-S-cluster containining protein